MYGHELVDVAAGGWHTVFVNAKHEVYTCGDNKHGQLGQGTREGRVAIPRPCVIKAGGDSTFRAAAGGLWHTLILAETCVWSCGWNRYGQLGVLFIDGDTEFTLRPLKTYTSVRPVAVMCGHHHSMFLTAGGDLWTWGRGNSGQLGHGDVSHQREPKLVAALSGRYWLVAAAGGDTHTAVAADSGGMPPPVWGL